MQGSTRTYHSTYKPPERLALIEEARRIGARHHITFAFNAHYTYDKAVERLQRWDRMVLNRLYRRNAFRLPPEQVFSYVIFPEYGQHIHFHGVVKLPEPKIDHFVRVAGARWKACVPTGNIHFADIAPGDDNERRWLDYATKSSSAIDYVTSAFLRLRTTMESPHRPETNASG